MLIEQSIAKQYGVLPSRQGELKYSDWAKMVSGLMDDTPLGRVVQLRTEQDKAVLKRLTKEERQMRAEWAAFQRARRGPDHSETDITQLETMIAALFGGGGRS